MAQPPRVGLLPTVQAIQADLRAGSAENSAADTTGTAGADAGSTDAGRWGGGFAYNPEQCGVTGTLDPCSPGARVITDNLDQIEGEPFIVWAGDKCAPFAPRDYASRARRQLRAARSYQIARELWRGDLALAQGWSNRPLASPESDVLTSGPSSVTDAFACLEGVLGECLHGARGMIHVTRQMATFLDERKLVRREGQLLLTVHDTWVVADAGYDGTGPNGEAAADGSVWAYATSPVQVLLGPEHITPDTLAEALDRSTNLVEYQADQLAAATWDHCCHLAVEVDLPMCDVGGPGS